MHTDGHSYTIFILCVCTCTVGIEPTFQFMTRFRASVFGTRQLIYLPIYTLSSRIFRYHSEKNEWVSWQDTKP